MVEENLEIQIGKVLSKNKLTLALAESCTGGLISHRLTNVPGSSEYFVGTMICYAYEAKTRLLGVNPQTLEKHGAVSEETVLEMAQGVREVLSADIGLSVCCVAGPGGGSPEKPVGTAWLAISSKTHQKAFPFLFEGERLSIKEQLCEKSLEKLLAFILAHHLMS